MNRAEAIANLRKAGIFPPSPMTPQHVAARTAYPKPRFERRLITSLFLRDYGLIAALKPVAVPPFVRVKRRVLSSYA